MTGGSGTGEGGYAGASSLSLRHMLTGLTPDATPRPGQSEAARYELTLLSWPAACIVSHGNHTLLGRYKEGDYRDKVGKLTETAAT